MSEHKHNFSGLYIENKLNHSFDLSEFEYCLDCKAVKVNFEDIGKYQMTELTLEDIPIVIDNKSYYPLDKTPDLYNSQEKRFICSSYRPYSKKIKGNWMHPDAIYQGTDPWDEYDEYKCPNCQIEFKVTLSD